MSKNHTIQLNSEELAAVLLLVGHSYVPGSGLHSLYQRLLTEYDISHTEYLAAIKGSKTFSVNAADYDRLVALKTSFDFSRYPSLPKGVVAFQYPKHGTGSLGWRVLKVENEDLDSISGYEVDLDKETMTWDYRTFLKKKASKLSRKA